ncbi:hypothetical protein [Planomicrobium sp. CPCC 101110]|uniref:hypothetical protein n=1 Tax=Planomicrobium sp. CPCC 101110 TaxID=2599619 RepID=UPI0011B5B51E|nr:hypothetical protein [Planomicrobium sp. CPCC 101110]TWT27686.1 hypothetical protein FQV30_03995 [Planomicrobium sp. CPCC 101110]
MKKMMEAVLLALFLIRKRSFMYGVCFVMIGAQKMKSVHSKSENLPKKTWRPVDTSKLPLIYKGAQISLLPPMEASKIGFGYLWNFLPTFATIGKGVLI